MADKVTGPTFERVPWVAVKRAQLEQGLVPTFRIDRVRALICRFQLVDLPLLLRTQGTAGCCIAIAHTAASTGMCINQALEGQPLPRFRVDVGRLAPLAPQTEAMRR